MSQLFPVQIQTKVLLNPAMNPADLLVLAQTLVSPSYPVSAHWVTAEHGHSQLQPQLIQNHTPEEATPGKQMDREVKQRSHLKKPTKLT